MGSESEERPTKKRARNSAASAEPGTKGKKQRGRPKVDTQDETAADRRRTQIRLAQRAYRQRKEMTISSLQKQVEQLQTVIDGMNNSFLRFNDQAMASDIFALRPSLASELKQTTETFVNLAKTAKTVASEDECEDSQEASEPSPPKSAAAPNISSRNYQDMNQPEQEMAGMPNVDVRINAQSTHLGLGYYRVSDDSEAPAPAPAYGQNVGIYSGLDLPNLSASHLEASRDVINTESHQSQTLAPSYPFRGIGEIDSVNVFRAEDFAEDKSRDSQNNSIVPTRTRSYDAFTKVSTMMPSPLTASVRPAFTYSFQETTFARRLQRACLERAFHLLSTAHLRPSDFNRVFRLCRHYSSRDELLRDFRNLLQQSVLQPLDFLNSPFLHLGGAGTHYPARDENGRVVREGDWNVRRVGPYATRVQMEEFRRNPRPDIIITQELEDDMESYSGEWFDSQDVEGYLEEIGVHIDAQASFAEAAVRTLDALARAQNPQSVAAHPDSEMGVLGEALDQFAPNHLAANFSMSPPSQTPFAATSPPQGSLPGSASVPSGTHGGRSTSNGPSTPDSGNLLQSAERIFDQTSQALWGNDFQPIDPKSYDEWDRYYDLNLAWMGNNQASLSEFGIGGVATGEQVDERRQNRTVTIDVQRFINGLIKRGVCIGRGPGFRRSDIHYALRAAIIEAF